MLGVGEGGIIGLMSEGIRRLSLLLGILGACVGGVFALSLGAVDEIYALSTYSTRLGHYEELLSAHEESLAAWNARREHTTWDGKEKFVKSDPAQTFSDALRESKGQWIAVENAESALPRTRRGRSDAENSAQPASADSQFDFSRFLEVTPPDLPRSPGDLGRPEQPEKPVVPDSGYYLLVIALPILGFLIPWGTVRVVGWVVMGFVFDWRGKKGTR